MTRILPKAFLLATLVAFAAPAVQAETLYVQKGVTLNGRKGPGTDHMRVATLPGGTALTVLERSGRWANVRTAEGLILWVFLDFLTQNQPQMQPAPQPSHNQPNAPTVQPVPSQPKPSQAAPRQPQSTQTQPAHSTQPKPKTEQAQPKPKPAQQQPKPKSEQPQPKPNSAQPQPKPGQQPADPNDPKKKPPSN